MIKGVIFDFNGTLFWDTYLHDQAWDIFLLQYNIKLTAAEKHLKLHGKNNYQLITELFSEQLSAAEIHRISLEKEKIYQSLVLKEKLQLADGVVELWNWLKKKGIVFSIVTASDKFNVDFFIEYLGLLRWFDFNNIIYADGTSKPKPWPDMFLKAMKMNQLLPSETIIFEDSETGLLAAQRAKPKEIIIVNSNGADYSNWNYPGITSFKNLDRSIFDSPCSESFS